MWRKNRRNNGGGSWGVDLNRNYPYEWGYDNYGSSPDPNSTVYRGTGPASEPETTAMVAFISGRQFNTALTVHTYGNIWIAPWGYDSFYPTNWDDYVEVGTLATEFNGYSHGPGAILYGAANGVTFDYDHGEHGIMSWTPEIGNSGDGFWPAQSRIVPLAEENLQAFQRTTLAAGPWIRVRELQTADAGDGDGDFEAGESVEITALLRNSGRLNSSLIDLTLTSTNPHVTITQASATAGPINAFSDGANLLPLALTISPGTAAGTFVDFEVQVTIDGWTQVLDGEIVVGSVITVAAYDFEASGDQGWQVGNPNDASTGEWTRVDPRGTDAQPEDDHTPTGTRCWVTGQGSPGGSLGENDVDGGRTTLISPTWDLSTGISPRIRYWRWYSNDKGASPNADILEIDLSNNGGSSWVNAETIGPSGAESNGGWYEGELDVASILTPTAQMRMRVIASDLGSGSIVEAALDDVVVSYIADSGCPDPANYCIAAPNSAGPGALMSWLGSTDVAADDFDLMVTGAPPGQFGLFFLGPDQQQVPLSDGYLCIDGTLVRRPVVVVDGVGQAVQNIDFGALGIDNGDTLQFQFWYRDPSGGPVGNNFSDGLEVEFCGD